MGIWSYLSDGINIYTIIGIMSDNQIELKLIPDMPEELKKLILDKDLIIFIGSGLSQLAGGISWNNLAKEFIKKYRSIESGYEYDAYEKLCNLSDKSPIRAISLCLHNISQTQINDDLKDFLKIKKPNKANKIYQHLRSFEVGYITTNYDSLIMESYTTKKTLENYSNNIPIIKDTNNLQELGLEDNMNQINNKVLYIHGRYNKTEKSINPILTLKDYLNHYKKDGIGRKALETIFENNKETILFIGLGMKEFEIIEHIQKPASSKSHYILEGFSPYEKCVLNDYKTYYQTLNIELIPYDKSQKGYDQLIEIIEKWANEISNIRMEQLKQIKKMNLINYADSYKFDAKIYKILKESPKYLQHFFNKSTNYRYLPHLIKDGYLNYNYQEQTNWNSLLYLNKIIERNINNIEVQKLLIKTILYITKEIEKNKIDKNTNYYIRTKLTEILKNINTDLINTKISKIIVKWYTNIPNSPYFINNILDFINKLLNNKKQKFAKTIFEGLLINNINNSDLILSISDHLYTRDFKSFCELYTHDLIESIAKLYISTINNKRPHKYSIDGYSVILTKANSNIVNISISNKVTNKFITKYIPYHSRNKLYTKINTILSKFNDPNNKNIINNILYYYYNLWNDYSYYSHYNLFDEKGSSSYSRKDKHLISLLKILLYSYSKYKDKRNFISLFNKINKISPLFSFTRILLYCIGNNFRKYESYFLSLLQRNGIFLFSNFSFETELYELLKRNTQNMSDNCKKLICQFIDNGPYYDEVFLNKNVNLEGYRKHWLDKWYLPLQADPQHQSNNNISDMFMHVNGPNVITINNISPFKREEILNWLINNPQIFIEKLQSFKEQENSDNSSERQSIEGICKQLKDVSSLDFEKFEKSLFQLYELPPNYITHILYGIKENKNINYEIWQDVFNFGNLYISKKKDTTSPDQMLNVIAAFSDLLLMYSKTNYNIDIASNFIKNNIDILISLYNFADNYMDLEQSCVSDTGHFITSLIQISIKKTGKNINNNFEDIWDKDMYNCYNKLLNNNIAESYSLFGYNFSNLLFLDAEYAIDTATLIFNSKDDFPYLWQGFIEGFIRSGRLFIDFYDWIPDFFKEAIKEMSENTFSHEALCYILFDFYLFRKDKLTNNSLIKYALENNKFIILKIITDNLSNKLHNNSTLDIGQKITKIQIKRLAREYFNFFTAINIENNDNNTDKSNFYISLFSLIDSHQKLDRSLYKKIKNILQNIKLPLDVYISNEFLKYALNIYYHTYNREFVYIVKTILEKTQYITYIENETISNIILKIKKDKNAILELHNCFISRNDYSKEDLFKSYLLNTI